MSASQEREGSSFPASELSAVLKSLLIFFSALVAKGYNTIRQVRMDSIFLLSCLKVIPSSDRLEWIRWAAARPRA